MSASESQSKDGDSGGVTELQLDGIGELEAAQDLDRWIDDVLEVVSPRSTSLVIRLVADDEMEEINQRFRSKTGATDVLSFPGEETPEGRHLGDIVIAAAVAERQARRHDHALAVELKVLSLHGILHCMGYDHETDDGEMERLELELRHRWIEHERG